MNAQRSLRMYHGRIPWLRDPDDTPQRYGEMNMDATQPPSFGSLLRGLRTGAGLT
jgi:hypothetical protein